MRNDNMLLREHTELESYQSCYVSFQRIKAQHQQIQRRQERRQSCQFPAGQHSSSPKVVAATAALEPAGPGLEEPDVVGPEVAGPEADPVAVGPPV